MITYWHTRRELSKLGNFINSQTVIRTPMRVRKYYYQGLTRPRLVANGLIYSIAFTNKDKIANIWDRGYKSYNYGRKVLKNNSLSRLRRTTDGKKYIRLLVGNKSGKTWRTLSEKGIAKRPSSWIMPALKGQNAYYRAYEANKGTIENRLNEALKKDISNYIKKGLKDALQYT